jgi:hypothetical protein
VLVSEAQAAFGERRYRLPESGSIVCHRQYTRWRLSVETAGRREWKCDYSSKVIFRVAFVQSAQSAEIPDRDLGLTFGEDYRRNPSIFAATFDRSLRGISNDQVEPDCGSSASVAVNFSWENPDKGAGPEANSRRSETPRLRFSEIKNTLFWRATIQPPTEIWRILGAYLDQVCSPRRSSKVPSLVAL